MFYNVITLFFLLSCIKIDFSLKLWTSKIPLRLLWPIDTKLAVWVYSKFGVNRPKQTSYWAETKCSILNWRGSIKRFSVRQKVLSTYLARKYQEILSHTECSVIHLSVGRYTLYIQSYIYAKFTIMFKRLFNSQNFTGIYTDILLKRFI